MPMGWRSASPIFAVMVIIELTLTRMLCAESLLYGHSFLVNC